MNDFDGFFKGDDNTAAFCSQRQFFPFFIRDAGNHRCFVLLYVVVADRVQIGDIARFMNMLKVIFLKHRKKSEGSLMEV